MMRWGHQNSAAVRGRSLRNAGFTLVELTMTVVVAIVLSAMAVPVVRSTMAKYRLSSAVGSVTGAIQSTRYRAIYQGYPFSVSFSQSGSSYQLASDPNKTGTFANVGSATPFASSGVTLGQNTTLQFHPSGLVQATAGSTTLTLSYAGQTETITVSSYGNINVTP